MSGPGPLEGFYAGELQGVWLLLVAPLLYLGFRALRPVVPGGAHPRAARFVALYTLAIAVQTVVDPLATGPLARALGGEAAKTGLGLLFVLIGDWRVYWLVLALAGVRRAFAVAVPLACAVPVVAYLATLPLPAPPPQVLYACHELLFVGAALALRRFATRRAEPALRPFLGDVADYVIVYYALWALADVVILGGGDWGFGLRVVPNQLYYAFFVPFVHWRFFASSSSPARTSTQAAR